ncbi:MAG: flagellar hook-length control protein FliK [Robiginitomaculum sp.]|nr:flagellar hook-length control protein FliK [Robiginitomaculum sp.]
MNNSFPQQSFATPTTARHPTELQAVSTPQPDTSKRNNDSEVREGLPAANLAGKEEFAAVLVNLENPFAIKEMPPALTPKNASVQDNRGLDISVAEPILPNSNLYNHNTTLSGQGEGEAAETKQNTKSAIAYVGNILLAGNENTHAPAPTIVPSPSRHIQALENTVLALPVPENTRRSVLGPEIANIANIPLPAFLSKLPHTHTATTSSPKTDIDTKLEGGKPDRSQIVINTVNPIQLAALDLTIPDMKIAQQPASNTETILLQSTSFSITEKSSSLPITGFQPVSPKQSQLIITQIGEALAGQITNKTSAASDKAGNTLMPVLVQLSPAELGRVQIQFSFNANERITANIIAENPETGALLKQKSDLLFTQLKLGGFVNIDLSFETKNENNFSNLGSGNSKNQNPRIEQHTPENLSGNEAHDKQQSNIQKPHAARTNAHIITDQLDITL